MIQQKIRPAFEGDPDAQRAVQELANPVARYADMTRHLASGVRSEAAAAKLRHEARELRNLIVARARSGGIVDHEMDTFWDAVQAEASAKYRRKVEIFRVPALAVVAPKAAPAMDPVERRLEMLIIDREERCKRAGELLAEARAKLAAHRAGKVAS